MIFGWELTPELIAVSVAAAVVFIIFAAVVIFLIFRRPRPKKILKRWKAIQAKLSKQEKWREALLEADELLDKALKGKNFSGKTIGEKLVKAEKIFTDKDEVWFGHKLSRVVRDKPDFALKKTDLKRALLGIRKGIKDLGGL